MNLLMKFGSIIALMFLAGCVSTTPAAPTATAAATQELLKPSPSATTVVVVPSTKIPVPLAIEPRSVFYQFMQRPSSESIRVMNYNINWDSIFPDGDPKNHSLRDFNRVDAFARVMQAVQPDVVCLQEINYLRGTRELGEFLAQALGSPPDQAWQVANVRDNVIATRFDLAEQGYELEKGNVRINLSQAAALIDLPNEQYGDTDLHMICSHFKAGGLYGDILERVNQADAIMAYVRDFKTPGGELDLKPGTPFVLAGDFNIYETDPHLHLRTMLLGDIYDESRYGEDLRPDWDETVLEDAVPSHNGLGDEFYTWRNDSDPFAPGILDRIIYSDSVMGVENAFVLNTMILSDEALAALGLQRDDVLLDAQSGYYDHFPLVVDFVIASTP
jgi:endonuclease/exonuclease/phosphatase family metal-dependent hydrolase